MDNKNKTIFELAKEIQGDNIIISNAETFKMFGEAVEKYIDSKIEELKNAYVAGIFSGNAGSSNSQKKLDN